MEDGLVQIKVAACGRKFARLNPCCNGRWSRTSGQWVVMYSLRGLNPCCNGRWSRTQLKELNAVRKAASLNPCCNGRWSRTLLLMS